VVLSLPGIETDMDFMPKDLLSTVEPAGAARFRVEEHIQFAVDRGLVPADAPLLALGMRNSLVNLRAPVIWQGRAHAVAGEHPEASLRPYYGLGKRNGALVIERALGGHSEASAWPDFYCAGIPVLWDDLSEAELFDLMLCEAADHSHLFDLPRGHHHQATDATRTAWAQLHRVFEDQIGAVLSAAARAMREAVAAQSPPLRRCDNYFHAAIGIGADGGLVCLFAHARLEDLGRRLRTLGCTRGICVENSGSVTPTWFPSGLNAPGIALVRAPNFRERGRAVMLIELADQRYDALPTHCVEEARAKPGSA